MDHSLLKEVNPGSQKWLVKVRLVRFTQLMGTDDPSKLLRLDFVMLDEQGKAMEGQVTTKWLPHFYPGLKEDAVYYVHYFEVGSARPNYRLVDHPYAAKFTKYTKVREATMVPDSFPLYACKLLTFADLRARAKAIDYLSDTVGLLTQCSDVSVQNTKSGKKNLRAVYITDGCETTKVALWGRHATQFEADRCVNMSKQGPVALLFTGLTTGWFNGQLSLQASTMCRCYINPTLTEAVLLQDRFFPMLGPAHYLGASEPAGGGPTTVEQLSKEQNPHDIWGKKYVVTAEIRSLIPEEPWWYMACKKCLHRSKPYGDAFKCTDSECTGTSAAPRYRLGLIAVDPTNSASADAPCIDLVCFGPTAEELIGAPVDALIDAGAGTQGFLPPHITRLYGRQYQFYLGVPRAALGRERPSFKIDSFSPAPPPGIDPTARATDISAVEGSTTPIPVTPVVNTSTDTRIVQQEVSTQSQVPVSQTPQPPPTPATASPNIVNQTEDKQDDNCDTKRRRKSKAARELSYDEEGM